MPSNPVLPSFRKHIKTVFDFIIGTRCGDNLFKFAIIVSENQLLGRCLMRPSRFLLDLLIRLWRIVTPRTSTILFCNPPGLNRNAWLVNFSLKNAVSESLNSYLFVVCRWRLHSVPFGFISEIDIRVFPKNNH